MTQRYQLHRKIFDFTLVPGDHPRLGTITLDAWLKTASAARK